MGMDPKIITLACFDATKAWVEGEYGHVKNFANPSGINKQEFHSFLNDWRIIRNSDPDQRENFRKYLNRDAKFEGPDCVKKVANASKKNGFSSFYNRKTGDRILPTSLISKVAFCKNPKAFTPIDSLSVIGMNEGFRSLLRQKVTLHSYKDFSSYFSEIVILVEKELKRQEWDAKTFSYGSQPIPKEYFSRRVTDKYLMLLGRKNISESKITNLKNKILLTRMTFTNEAYEILNK